MTKAKSKELAAESEIALSTDVQRTTRLQKAALIDGVLTLQGTKEEHALLGQAFGSDSGDFQTYCIRNLLSILPESKDAEDFTLDLNAALVMLRALAPADAVEAMLAMQMVATNHLALMSVRRSNRAETVESRQMNGNLATKFSRTFTAQMEALGRHRRGGKQVVEHVHVNAGGQAVIAGTVHTSKVEAK